MTPNHRPIHMHDTGKVVIGRSYIRPAMRIEGDALEVQRAILTTRNLGRAHPFARLIAPIWRLL